MQSQWLRFCVVLIAGWALAVGALAQNQGAASDAGDELTAAIESAFAMRNTDPVQARAELAALQVPVEATEDWAAVARLVNYRANLAFHASALGELEALLDTTLMKYRQRFEPLDRGRLELLQARLDYRRGNNERALAQLEVLEEAFQDTPLLADIEMSISVVKHAQGIFDEAVAKGLDALALYEAQNDINGQIEAHKNLGIDYFRIDDLDSSLHHFNRGSALLEQSEDVFVAVQLAANTGITLQALGDLEGAIEAYQGAYDAAVTLNRPLTQAQSLLNIATIYSNEYQQDDEAMAYYADSLAISEDHELTYGVMLNHMNMGISLGRLSRFEEAMASFDEAFALAESLDRPNEMQHLLGEMAVVLANSGDYQRAYEASLRQRQIAQTLFNEDRDRVIAELRTAYETKLTEQALALAETENQRQLQWIQLLSVVVFLCVVLAVAAVAFFAYRNRTLKDLYDRNIELINRSSPLETRRNAANDSEGHLAGVFARLTEVMEAGEMVKDPNLTLAEVARVVQSNEKYVSKAIAQFAKMNFNHYINYYRTIEARKILTDPEDTSSITEVMLGCGFGHKSTFYGAFRRFAGMTPSQFRAVAQRGDADTIEPMLDPMTDPGAESITDAR